jgi:hypothetical protein
MFNTHVFTRNDALLTRAHMYEMSAPPSEWFEPAEKVVTPKPAPTPTRSKPDWLRVLEVYGFLFDAHAREKKPYK